MVVVHERLAPVQMGRSQQPLLAALLAVLHLLLAEGIQELTVTPELGLSLRGEALPVRADPWAGRGRWGGSRKRCCSAASDSPLPLVGLLEPSQHRLRPIARQSADHMQRLDQGPPAHSPALRTQASRGVTITADAQLPPALIGEQLPLVAVSMLHAGPWRPSPLSRWCTAP
jgi:hypothetical protein